MPKRPPGTTALDAIRQVMAGAIGAAAAARYKRRKGAGPSKKARTTRTTRRTRRTPVTTKRRTRKSYRENHSTETKETRLTVPARAPSVMRLLKAQLEPQWYRVQGVSQFDTSTGFYALANRTAAAPFDNILPMHIWDLTSTINYQWGTVQKADAGFFCTKNANSANCFPLNAQDPQGGVPPIATPNSQWYVENNSGGMDDLPKRKVMHEWTSIKLNLYGVRKRATKFVCQLVMVTREAADFIDAASTSTEKLKLMDYLVRPFMYSNLNSGDPQSKSLYKVLKSYETTLSPITSDEYAGTTSVPHIQTLNWFVKHNRVRHYDWKRTMPTPNLNSAGYDAQAPPWISTRTAPTTRVYLVLRALSPEARAVDNPNLRDPDPISEPSYDIVIRNKFVCPT